MYKLMTKFLADRHSMISGELVSHNQYTFIKGRHISDSTMLAEEMLYDFCRKITPKRCYLEDQVNPIKGYRPSKLGYLEDQKVKKLPYALP